MELAVNYSVELENLLRAEKVEVDRIKCADWPDMIVTAQRLERLALLISHAAERKGRAQDGP